MIDFKITNLTRTPEGYWTATVVRGTESIEVHKRFGSWMTGDPQTGMKELDRDVRFALAAEVAAFDAAEKKGRVKRPAVRRARPGRVAARLRDPEKRTPALRQATPVKLRA